MVSIVLSQATLVATHNIVINCRAVKIFSTPIPRTMQNILNKQQPHINRFSIQDGLKQDCSLPLNITNIRYEHETHCQKIVSSLGLLVSNSVRAKTKVPLLIILLCSSRHY